MLSIYKEALGFRDKPFRDVINGCGEAMRYHQRADKKDKNDHSPWLIQLSAGYAPYCSGIRWRRHQGIQWSVWFDSTMQLVLTSTALASFQGEWEGFLRRMGMRTNVGGEDCGFMLVSLTQEWGLDVKAVTPFPLLSKTGVP
ncbi:hypothetical protein Tco_0417661 [Tanacetum coccineum]